MPWAATRVPQCSELKVNHEHWEDKAWWESMAILFRMWGSVSNVQFQLPKHLPKEDYTEKVREYYSAHWAIAT